MDFRRARMLETQFDKAQLTRCDFRDADLRECDAEDTVFVDCDFRGSQMGLLRVKGSVFTRCKFHGMTGKPKLDGEITLMEPDLSLDGDGTQIVSADDILRLWRA